MRNALRQRLRVRPQRSLPLQRPLDTRHIHARLTFRPRPHLNPDRPVPRNQPRRNITREQRRLPRTRRNIDHQIVALRRLHRLQTVIRRPHLPRRRLPTEIPPPKKREIVQRPLRLNRQRLIHKHPRHHAHPEQRGSLQPRTARIIPLKLIRHRQRNPRRPRSRRNILTSIPRLEIPPPTRKISLLHFFLRDFGATDPPGFGFGRFGIGAPLRVDGY